MNVYLDIITITNMFPRHCRKTTKTFQKFYNMVCNEASKQVPLLNLIFSKNYEKEIVCVLPASYYNMT